MYVCVHACVHPTIPLADCKGNVGRKTYFYSSSISSIYVSQRMKASCKVREGEDFGLNTRTSCEKSSAGHWLPFPLLTSFCPLFQQPLEGRGYRYFADPITSPAISVRFKMSDVDNFMWLEDGSFVTHPVLLFLSVSRIWEYENGRTKRGRWGNYCSSGSFTSFKISFSLQKANSLLLAFNILNAVVDIAHCNTNAPKPLHEQLSRPPC